MLVSGRLPGADRVRLARARDRTTSRRCSSGCRCRGSTTRLPIEESSVVVIATIVPSASHDRDVRGAAFRRLRLGIAQATRGAAHRRPSARARAPRTRRRPASPPKRHARPCCRSTSVGGRRRGERAGELQRAAAPRHFDGRQRRAPGTPRRSCADSTPPMRAHVGRDAARRSRPRRSRASRPAPAAPASRAACRAGSSRGVP